MKPKRLMLPLGGIDDRVLPAEGTAKTVTNMEWRAEGYWAPMPGSVEVSDFTGGSGAITALHWFQPRPNQRWLVVERRVDQDTSRISFVDFPAGGTPTLITDRRRLDSSDIGSQFLDQGRWLWILSPLDALVRWDGERLQQVGFTVPCAAPTLGWLTGADNAGQENTPINFTEFIQRGLGRLPTAPAVIIKWTYAYACTYINELGQESPLSAVVYQAGSNATGNGVTAGRTGVMVRMPKAPDHVAAVRIWRSRNLEGLANPEDGVDLYLVGSFTTRHAFEYFDCATDEELGELFNREEVGPVPTGARAMAAWAESTWLGGTPEIGHRAYFSTAGFPEQYGPLNYVDVGSADTGPILAFHPIPRGLLAFKAGSTWIIKGNHVVGFSSEIVDDRRGTISPRAIVTVAGLGTCFLDPQKGPQVVIGSLDDDQPTTIAPIGDGIMKFWGRRVGPLLQAAIVVYDPARDEVWWQVPQGGNVLPKIGMVLHTAGGLKWSIRDNWEIGAFAYYRGRVWMGATDDTNTPGVYLLTSGSRKRFDTGSDIEGTYTTSSIQLDGRAWHLNKLELVGYAMGAVDVSLATRDDHELTQKPQTTTQQKHHTHERDQWGTGLWATASNQPTYQDYDLTLMTVSTFTEMAFERQIKVASTRMRLAQIRLDLTTPDQAPESPRERR